MNKTFRKSALGQPQVETFIGTKEQKKVLTYHFIGIGGCGMSGLAQVLSQRGHRVSGSDMHSSAVVEKLGRRDIVVNIGHSAQWLGDDVDCVVVSAAVNEDNPEWVQARQNGVRVCKYAQLLGQLSETMTTLAVAGTHGKSTTSGWLAYMLKEGGSDPSFVIGADVEQLGGGSGAGKGSSLVVEACEYDRSFLNIKPQVAAILNIEADHLDYYRDLDEIVEAFSEFVGRVGSDGLLIANRADENVIRAVEMAQERYGRGSIQCEFFNVDGLADWQAAGLQYKEGYGSFDLTYRGGRLGSIKLSLAGAHNVANSLATAAMGRAAGLTDEQICHGLENYVGVSRRMSYKGKVSGVVVLDDYAHHPTEIKATLAALSDVYKPRRLWCVFQPHQHSRTRFFMADFAASFSRADQVLLPDIYFVRDSQELRHEVNASQLAQEISKNGGAARYLANFDNIVERLTCEVRQGDVVVTMGAGDVWKVADELICRLGRNS